MGVLTLNDFYNETIAALGNRTDLTLARVTSGLNMKQSRLSRVYDFSDMDKLSTTTLSVTGNPVVDKYMSLPPQTKTIHSLRLVDNTSAGSIWASRKLIEKPWRWFDSKFPVPEALPPDWPTVYTRWGCMIEMVPPPLAAFQMEMRYVQWPTPFVATNTGQTSDFDNKDDILLHDTIGYFWRSFGRIDQAEWHEKFVERLVAEAIEREDTRPDMDVAADIPGLGVNFQYWNNPFVQSVSG